MCLCWMVALAPRVPPVTPCSSSSLSSLWKFDDDADWRKHWAGVFANKDFVEGFASKFRPLVITQEVKLLTAAPWGPHP
jgi:hypothetical protein